MRRRKELQKKLIPAPGGIPAGDWLIAGGDLGDLIRARDWSATPIGPRSGWPQSLRTAVNIALASRFPMAIAWGSDLVLIYNDGFRLIAAEKHPEALGRSACEICREAWQFSEPIFERVLARGESLYLEDQRLPIHRGAVPMHGYFTLGYSPVRDEAGAIRGVLMTLLETTKHVQAEEIRETDLRDAQRLAHLGSWLLDVRTGEFTVSEEIHRIFGRDEPPLKYGHNLWGGTQMFATEDYARLQALIDRCILDGAPQKFESEVLRPDGTRRAIIASCEAIRDAGGTVVKLRGTVQDITDRKRAEEALRASEERLRVAQEKAKLRVWDWDRNKDLIHFTLRFSPIFGLPSSDPVPYEAFRRKVHPEDLVRVEAELEEAIARREPFRVEYRAFAGSGEVRWICSKGGAIYDQAGKPSRVLGINQDITERKQIEADLREAKRSAEEAKREAERATRAKDRFLAVLSHELRTPLTPVLAGVSMLREHPALDADLREHLEIVQRNVEMEVRLIDDLLDVTGIAHGKIKLSRERVELHRVIEAAIEVCRAEMVARELRFDVDRGPGEYWVDADAHRLQQVFWNLLKNAIKFTPRLGRIGIHCRPDLERDVVVEVRDTGVGIEPAALPKIFDAFEQAEQSAARHLGGLGLGLTITKALIELHEGTIEAESEGNGRGATFRVRLPLRAAPSPSHRLVSTVAEAGRRSLHILLVEDHQDTARMLQRLLSKKGHRVDTAGDVSTAQKLISEASFDVLISDLGLPDGSGLQLLEWVRGRGMSLPAIALTGYG